MKKIFFSAFLLLVICFYSCKQEQITSQPNERVSHEQIEKYREDFSKTLAVAVKDASVRSLIKQEASRQFDGEAEFLFQSVKSTRLANGETLFEYLSSIYGDVNEFQEIVNSIPTLTILIPSVYKFSIDEWDVERQVPAVTSLPVFLTKQKATTLKTYYQDGSQKELNRLTIPTEPVIVVKNSERITISNHSIANAKTSQQSFQAGDFTFAFIDNSFKKATKQEQNARVDNIYRFSDKVRYAYQNNLSSVRDYVYYGIAPELGVNSGTFSNQYSEQITSVKFTPGFENHIIDDVATDWTDGNLELMFNITLIDNKTSVSPITKWLSVPLSRVCDCYYNSSGALVITGFNKTYDVLGDGNVPKLSLLSWDMKRYGDSWKVDVLEHDAQSTTTYSINSTVTSSYGTNYNNNVKEGANFGSTSSNGVTYSQGYSLAVSGGSDNLGNFLVDWKDKVILEDWIGDSSLPYEDRWAKSHEYTTGIISVAIEPRLTNGF